MELKPKPIGIGSDFASRSIEGIKFSYFVRIHCAIHQAMTILINALPTARLYPQRLLQNKQI